jgi:hypothetical protein
VITNNTVVRAGAGGIIAAGGDCSGVPQGVAGNGTLNNNIDSAVRTPLAFDPQKGTG